MNERRQYGRFMVQGMDFQCRTMVASEAKLVNISIGGCSILHDRRLELGPAKLKLQENAGAMTLDGLVVWSTPAGTGVDGLGDPRPLYESGIRFKSTVSPQGWELGDFIEDFAGEHLGHLRLTGLRVKLKESSRAVVCDYGRPSRVLILSLGGMLIQSPRPLDAQKTYALELVYPEGQGMMPLTGRVTCCAQGEGMARPFWEVGVSFQGLGEKTQARLGELLCAISHRS